MLFDSVPPPPPLPRWAATLKFVIPTGAKRRGGTCSFTFGHSESAVDESPPVPFPHERKLQVPPLRFAPVGMTNLRAAVHLGSGGGGGTESNNSNQPGFGLPAFSSTHSASCAVQKAIRPLTWTALAESSPGRKSWVETKNVPGWNPGHPHQFREIQRIQDCVSFCLSSS